MLPKDGSVAVISCMGRQRMGGKILIQAEIKVAINRLEMEKAPGIDEPTAVKLKSGGNVAAEWMHKIRVHEKVEQYQIIGQM